MTVLSRPSKTIDGDVTGNLLRKPITEITSVTGEGIGKIFAKEFQCRSECRDCALDLAKDAKCIVADKGSVNQPKRINALLDGRNEALNRILERALTQLSRVGGSDGTPRSLGLVGGQTLVLKICLLYTSPSPRDATLSRMPSSA